MAKMACGIARGRVLSPTTAAMAVEVSHQYGDLSHASLLNIRSHTSWFPLNVHVNWKLSKQETRWPVSHDHIAGSDVVSQDVYKTAESRKKINRSTWVNLRMQLTSLQFNIKDPFHGQLAAVTTRYPLTSIPWPYRGLRCATHRGRVFLNFTAAHVMDFHWIAGASILTKY